MLIEMLHFLIWVYILFDIYYSSESDPLQKQVHIAPRTEKNRETKPIVITTKAKM